MGGGGKGFLWLVSILKRLATAEMMIALKNGAELGNKARAISNLRSLFFISPTP